MSDEAENRFDGVFSAMDARLREIRSVKFVKSEDNLTKEQQRYANEVDYRAGCYRNMRIEGSKIAYADWPSRFSDSHLYAWAMSDYDHFQDLLEINGEYDTTDRSRLPGVTRSDVERRIKLLERVIEEHRAQLMRQTKRERTR